MDEITGKPFKWEKVGRGSKKTKSECKIFRKNNGKNRTKRDIIRDKMEQLGGDGLGRNVDSEGRRNYRRRRTRMVVTEGMCVKKIFLLSQNNGNLIFETFQFINSCFCENVT